MTASYPTLEGFDPFDPGYLRDPQAAMQDALRERPSRCVRIPARRMVRACTASANSDPSQFPDPLRFDPARANAHEHLGLGVGRHFCLGAPLARPEARAALGALYRRMPDLAADLEQELEFVPALTTRVIVSQRISWGRGAG